MTIAALGPAGIVEMLAQGFSALMLLGIIYGVIGLAFDKNVCLDCGTRWR